MEVYNDVDGIVPRWFEYKGIITCLNDGDPINLRLLNQDETNFIKGCNVFQGDFGYWYINNLSNGFKKDLLFGSCQQPDGQYGMTYSMLYFDNNVILQSSQYQNVGNTGIDCHFEIKQRLRGAPPKLLSAETDTTGNQITLTFDKQMTSFNDLSGANFFISTDIDQLECILTPSNIVGNKIVIDSSPENWYVAGTGIKYGDDINIEFSYNSATESIDYGRVNPGTYNIVNNVPAPLEIINAYTNEAGTELTIEFNKDVAIQNIPNTFYIRVLDEFGNEYTDINQMYYVGGTDRSNYFISCVGNKIISTLNLGYYDDGDQFIQYIPKNTDIILISQNGSGVTNVGNDEFGNPIYYVREPIYALDGSSCVDFSDLPITNNIIQM